ncbi:site-specific integrase [Paracoccus indicus]|uniref:site-specific integrase n=1 Tax=Paracoccus indicus TaxID=2079229 RepID=UPI0013B4613E|nr:site-specific integrase [Paracoccus indicus]
MSRPQATASGVEISATTTTKERLFAAVKAVRSHAMSSAVVDIVNAEKATSETTRAQYRRIIARRMKNGVPDLEGLSRSSWYPTRAALKVGLAERVRDAMKAQDKAQRGGDFETAERLVKVAAKAIEQLEALENAKAPPPEKVQNSARKRLPKARGDSWQAKVYDAATETMRPAIAVMWATGARPAEIGMGVDIERVKGGLRVRIPGAKVNDAKGSGQKVRVLLVNEDTPAGRALAESLGDASKITVKRKAARITKDFTDHIRPRLPASYQVSAYSFRHQAAANMKADLGDAEKVASAMGHRTTRSQQHYGTARQSQSAGGAVIDARATHQPKETRGIRISPPKKPESGPNLS